MMFLIRKLFWVLVGIAAALQVDRWLGKQRTRWSPNAITGGLLDMLNESMERRAGPSSPRL